LGQRTSSETLIAVIVAFWRQPVWSQVDLAREVGVSGRVVRRYLDELCLSGWPLDREEDHPRVYWSVPKGWFPAGVLLDPVAVSSLVRGLVRIPPSATRSRLLLMIAGHAPAPILDAIKRVIPPRSSEVEEALLPMLLDSLADSLPIRLKYWTASRGSLASRTVSVQRVLIGPPTRFVAWCHSSNALRWFRLDNASTISADPATPYHPVDDSEVDALIQQSVDGFHGHERLRIVFHVRDPDARWVAHNLPDGLTCSTAEGGIVVQAETAGLLPIARFVVGLGEAARCETPELAKLVRELAAGALRATEPG